MRHRRVSLAAIAMLLAPNLAGAADLPGRVVQQAYSTGSTRVLVELDTEVLPEGTLANRAAIATQRGRITARGQRLARSLRGTASRVLRSFQTVPYVAVEVDPAGLEALARAAFVRSIEEDTLAYPLLDRSTSLIGAPVAHEAGYRGEGQTIVVIDTGVDSNHASVADRVVAEACFSSRSNCPNESSSQLGAGSAVPCTYSDQECSHGTHVAAIAMASAGSLPLPARNGVAPGADLIAIQVFSLFEDDDICFGAPPCAASFTSDQIAALEHVLLLADSFPITVVNLSIGGSTKFTTPEECDSDNLARKAIIDNLRSRNIATVAAAGNEAHLDGLTSPACISSAIAVGATTLEDSVASFSNSADHLSLLAPGQGIVSALDGGGWTARDGTSMAAPHVAGGIALLRQQSPDASVDELLSKLRSTGVDVVDARNGLTTPRIDLAAAIRAQPTPTLGLLEFPFDGRFASGIGSFTGWVCDAQSVAIRVDGGPLRTVAYGTARDDTRGVCRDSDNGFALLHNFNLDGPGFHVAELIADGVVVSSSSYQVSTFGVPFIQGAEPKSYVLENFEGRDVIVQWLEESQGFEIVGID